MLFIVFEGVDKGGKSTHAQRVATHLRRHLDKPVVLTREPGGCTVGEKLRAIMIKEEMSPETELLLMFAARIEHLRKVIIPALDCGSIVICDRFVDSTYVYQGYIKGVDVEHIKYLEKMINAPNPDILFFFSQSYNQDITDRLEDVNRAKVVQGYRARMRPSWIEVPHSNKNNITKFITNKIMERV
jgi:dTMP kinase